jgi:hypothetical protein
MNISLKDLRDIKHKLPTGSVTKIASELNLEAQTVRNFFGAKKFENGQAAPWHLQQGPDGGIVFINDTTILDVANRIINENKRVSSIMSQN